MDALANSLRNAIEQRRASLSSRLTDLRGAVPGERLAIARVLDLLSFFPQALDSVVEQEWARNSDALSRVQLLRPLLRHTTRVASFIDDWFAHSGSTGIPLHLLDALERSSDALGLGQRQAVVAVGPANNFETVTTGIEQAVFGPLGPLCPPIPSELQQEFILMRAPRFEGREARWHPILLGHELAHIAVKQKDALITFDLQKGFDHARALSVDVPGAPMGPLGALRLFEIYRCWVEELLCDAFAVWTFGAGAVASLPEFLEVIGATDLLNETHPPGRLRTRLLVDWLGISADPRIESTTQAWRSLAADPIAYSEAWAQFLVDTLLARAPDLLATVGTWAPRYDADARTEIIAWAADALQAGRPPEVTCVANGHRQEVSEADVIVASWVGITEGFATPVDQLAEKALGDIGFLRRWGEAGGSWIVPPASSPGLSPEGGTLNSDEIRARLSTSEPGRQLVVTPLLPDYASGASLDLRLGNRFIVFVRSRTASFNPLDQDQDPRQVQRSLQLAWGDSLVLHPSELVLAATLEYLVLPGDLTAQVISRSSYGRLGLLSATAVQVHPHFHGCLTLELVNLGTVPIELTPGERIAQLVLSPTSMLSEPSGAKYHCPIGPEFSKVRRDGEAAVLRDLGQAT